MSQVPLNFKLTPTEAIALQRDLSGRIDLTSAIDPDQVRLVAGTDISMQWHGHYGYAAVVVMDLETGETLETAMAEGELTFPYVPGLLAFREIPLLLEAFDRLKRIPEAVLCDGQGIAHPRGMGLGAMFGLAIDLPTVGCAKSRLCGEHSEPGRERGRWRWLTLEGRRIGMVLRTRDGTKPLYVSPGHKVDFFAARRLLLRCCPRYRLAEPIRRAHHAVNQLRSQRL